MANPLRQLKTLPWIPLLQVSLLTSLVVTVLEWLLIVGAQYLPPVRYLVMFLFSSSLAILTLLAIAVGVGVLAVLILERWFRHQILPNTTNLWALVPCLVLFLWLKSLLSLSPILGTPDFNLLIGIVLGIFWKGRPYWRWL